ncbi:MAG: iron-sulfur cluster carrier protein ApbC [Ignavibacteria bacterium]|nr:iron-sulfur cluster carrier protein ApbC [Ignavibacteria bacterium]MBI3766408.1 iron-sulfur cluster carrier protein ApbC [Ignavibacteriales bacterium]
MKKSLTESNVLDALRVVKDPDLHRDIVALNFVKDISIADRNVSFKIELTTPSCPVRDELKADAERAVRDQIEGVNNVAIEMTSNVRTNPTQQRASLLPGVKNTIAVASGKGGVGKSTVAVNLAVSLAMDGAKVGLLDADIYGPSIPLMMGVNDRPQLVNQKLLPLDAHGVKVMSIGFLVDPMQAVIWRGPMVSGAVKQFMSDVNWGELDYLIFDLPPGTGDIHLTLVQTIPLSGAIVVTTPQDISLADARKAHKMFEKVNVPVLGIIENMSYHICANCGHREEIFSTGGGEKASKELGSPFLGAIPIYTPIRVGGDIGKPIVVMEPNAEQSKMIRQIARNMAAQVSIQQFSGAAKPEIEISLDA